METLIIAPPFAGFPSIPRLSRDMIVTEKLDGTNGIIHITGDGRHVIAGSRSRWLVDGADNYGFAAWVREHEEELRQLGPGTHFGEWWGKGIQRGYGLSERRFSLFNVSRWACPANESDWRSTDDPYRCFQVPVCHVVPVLLRHTFDTNWIDQVLDALAEDGSTAAPGFMQPEGIVVFHVKSGTLFKKTLDKHDGHKGA